MTVPHEQRTHAVTYAWTHARVRKVLSAVVYMGVAEWGARNFKEAKRQRAAFARKHPDPQRVAEAMMQWHAENKSEVIRIEGAHEPLVSDALWDAANRVRQARGNSGRAAKKREYTLNGVVRCRCGRAYSGGAVKGSTTTAKDYTYECTASSVAKHGERCIHSPILDVDALDRVAIDLVFDRLTDPHLLHPLDAAAAAEPPVHPEIVRMEIDYLEQQRAANIKRQVDMLVDPSGWSDEAVEAARQRLVAEECSLQERLDRLRRDLVLAEDDHERFADARSWIADMRHRVLDAQSASDIASVGELVRTVVARVEVCPAVDEAGHCREGHLPRVSGGSRKDSHCKQCSPQIRVFLRYAAEPARVFEILSRRDGVPVQGDADEEGDLGLGHKTVRTRAGADTRATLHVRAAAV
ncbi:hypothetical protein EG835_10415, partial [bacterium]|nr:hypothetical protein [bacterium]